MIRDIYKNPKKKYEYPFDYGNSDGFITNLWRCRVINFFASLIPAHISTKKQIWLKSPQDINEFIQEIRKPEIDLSSIEYVCVAESIADIFDIIEFFSLLSEKLSVNAKILFYNFNWIWAPFFRVFGLLKISRNRSYGNFYRTSDLNCFLEMAGWEITRKIQRYIFPFSIPLISTVFDDFIVKLPFFRKIAINSFFIARMKGDFKIEDQPVSVLIPCKNEESNIKPAVTRIPLFGKSVEMIFINDQSTDATEEKIISCQREFPDKTIVLIQGRGQGKAEAIREGMKKATGSICIILDADLTVAPEDLPQFYDAIIHRRADFIHGTRFVYPQEDGAMRFANIIGNLFFSSLFSYILEQRTTDTLCGTKVFWRRDWLLFEEMREILKKTDQWGDYNLIFGASRFGLKIAQLPVRYYERLEGETKMNKRLKNGMIMLRVAFFALWKVKFFN